MKGQSPSLLLSVGDVEGKAFMMYFVIQRIIWCCDASDHQHQISTFQRTGVSLTVCHLHIVIQIFGQDN
jgi:hypothetical protein